MPIDYTMLGTFHYMEANQLLFSSVPANIPAWWGPISQGGALWMLAFDTVRPPTPGSTGNLICLSAYKSTDNGTTWTRVASVNQTTTLTTTPGGAISVALLNSGSGYTPGIQTTTTVTGSGSGLSIQINTVGIAGYSLGAAGTGYVVGDAGRVNGWGTLAATYQITSVGAGGAVTGFSITFGGAAYTIGTQTTTHTSGVGTGLTVNILSLGIGTFDISTIGHGYVPGDIVNINGGTGGQFEILWAYDSTFILGAFDQFLNIAYDGGHYWYFVGVVYNHGYVFYRFNMLTGAWDTTPFATISDATLDGTNNYVRGSNSCLAINPANTAHMCLVIGGHVTPSINYQKYYYTTNSGSTWTGPTQIGSVAYGTSGLNAYVQNVLFDTSGLVHVPTYFISGINNYLYYAQINTSGTLTVDATLIRNGTVNGSYVDAVYDSTNNEVIVVEGELQTGTPKTTFNLIHCPVVAGAVPSPITAETFFTNNVWEISPPGFIRNLSNDYHTVIALVTPNGDPTNPNENITLFEKKSGTWSSGVLWDAGVDPPAYPGGFIFGTTEFAGGTMIGPYLYMYMANSITQPNFGGLCGVETVGVAGPPSPPIILACPTTNTGKVGVPFTATMIVSGGTPPFSFLLTAGPPWLSITPSTGVLSGTPTAGGTFSYTVQVTDAALMTATVTCSITVPTPLTAGCPTAQPVVGVPFSATIPVSGGTPPYTFTLTGGALPLGLSLNSTTGVISGVPLTDAAYSYTITVTDSST